MSRSKSPIKLLAIALLSLVQLSYASADVNLQDDIFSLDLEELLSLTITSSTLHEQSLTSVPSAITVYNAKHIRLLGFENLTDLLRFVPGFQVQRSDANSMHQSVSSRGLLGNGSGREILVLVDGQRLNYDNLGGANTLLANYSLQHVERVEVIRGPGSSIYGSNAFAGVINIITKPTNKATLSVATHGLGEATLQANQQVGEVNLSGFIKHTIQDGAKFELEDIFSGQSVSAKDPYRSDQVYLKVNWQYLEIIANHQTNEAQDFYVGGFYDPRLNLSSISHDYLRLNYRTQLGDNWQLKASAFYSEHDYNVRTRISPAPFEISIAGQLVENDKGLELTATYQRNDQQVTLGAEYRSPNLLNTDAFTSGFVEQYLPQAPTTSRDITGLFAQWQGNLIADIDYIIGGRFDDYSNVGSHFSPRLGINWALNDNRQLKLLYGESFRAPSRVETDIQNSNAFIANPDLQPEIFRNIDLIWQQSTDNAFLSVGVFKNWIVDGVVPTQTTPIMFINDGEAESFGAEVELDYFFTNHLQLKFNYYQLFDYQRSFYNDSDQVLSSALIFTADNYSIAALVNYKSSVKDPNNDMLSYTNLDEKLNVDINASWQLSPNIELSLRAMNLFDQAHRSIAFRPEILNGVPDYGRRWQATVRWSF